jgi:hypothetical protein
VMPRSSSRWVGLANIAASPNPPGGRHHRLDAEDVERPPQIIDERGQTELGADIVEALHQKGALVHPAFYVGNLKWVGRIYQQTFVDTFSKLAFAKLYDRKRQSRQPIS